MMKVSEMFNGTPSRVSVLLLAILTVMTVFSCSKNKNPLGAVKVTGQVTLDGRPVPWASVTFFPKLESIPLSSGRTDEKGNFLLTPVSGVGGEGALAGDYFVSMTKSNLSEEQMYSLGNPADSLTSSSGSGMPAYKERQDFFPKQYTSPKTSGFEASVEKGKKNHFVFECFSE